MIKTFVSYHHGLDQRYKEAFVDWASSAGLIQDLSVDTGDIDGSLDPQTIRRIIRDNYLRESDVTILLCGRETRYRKHVDWELKSSMIDGAKNRRSGILVIDLPETSSTSWHAAFPNEAKVVYPDYTGGWMEVKSMVDFEARYPDMPRRILENLLQDGVKISIVPWVQIFGYTDRLRFLLSETAKAGKTNRYDLSRKMRMRNFNPGVDVIDWRI